MADTPAATGGLEQHDRHDPERIAALLDRDLTDAQRALAEVQVAACDACAALLADLTSLAIANLELVAPVRPRDFILTEAEAAMLVVHPAGEPVGAGARLTGDMTDAGARHAAHDRLLIASLVDRSVPDSERVLAEAQLASCRDCALLYDDLVALSAATRTLPAPTRQRDFTLTAADAERLRVRGWRRLLAAIGSSRDAFSRPLALGLTTLGLAGLLVATIPGALTGLGGSTAAQTTVGDAAGDASRAAGGNPETLLSPASAAPSLQADAGPAAIAAAPAPAASGALPAPEAAVGSDPSRESDKLFVNGEGSLPPGEPRGSGSIVYTYGTEEQPRRWPGTIASLLLLAGLALFGLRWIARRTRDG